MTRKHGDNYDRPLQLVRLRVEFEIACAADMGELPLALRLVTLAAAGLDGMVLDIVRAEVNGRRVPEAEQLMRSPGSPHRLRPAPDQRIVGSAYEIHRIARELFEALGVEAPAGNEPTADSDYVYLRPAVDGGAT